MAKVTSEEGFDPCFVTCQQHTRHSLLSQMEVQMCAVRALHGKTVNKLNTNDMLPAHVED